MDTTINAEAAAAALQDTVKAYRAFTRWLTWCDGLGAAKTAAGLYELADYDTALSIAVEQIYTAAHKRPPMPPKERKYRMYDDAYRAASLAGVQIAPGSIRNLTGVARVIAEVTAALAVAGLKA